MKETLISSIRTADFHAQYDTYAKNLLSNKVILSHVLKGTIEEFSDMEPEEILPLIEGEPYISEIPVAPGETNAALKHFKNKIRGSNTEDAQPEEGTVYFDILFYVRMRDGISQMIINIEAQKSVSPGYYIKNRAIYYTSRILSSQKERDFTHSNYNEILKTYSIWICFNAKENCLNRLHMVDTPLVGNTIWAGDTDLFNVVLVGLDQHLTKAAVSETKSDLHYLLGTLFSDQIDASEKITLLDKRFPLENHTEIRKELDEMCNLSYGIFERGMKEEKQRVIREMLLDHQPYDLIMKYTAASREEIQAIEEELLVGK